jgi:hypothetical protein
MTITSGSSFLTSYPNLKTDGSNWAIWKVGAKTVLMREGCWAVVGGDKASGTRTASEAKSDSEAFATLVLMAGEAYYEELDALERQTGSAVWAHLVKEHEKGSRSNRIEVKRSFYTVSHNPLLPIETYTREAQARFARLKAIGVKVEDQDLADVLIGNLAQDYGTVATALALRTEEVKASEVVSALKEEEQRRTTGGLIQTYTEDQAMRVTSRRRPGADEPCRRCGSRDHWIRDCRAKEKGSKKTGGDQERAGMVDWGF